MYLTHRLAGGFTLIQTPILSLSPSGSTLCPKIPVSSIVRHSSNKNVEHWLVSAFR